MEAYRLEKLLAEVERQLEAIVSEDLLEMMDWRKAGEGKNDEK